MNKMIWGIEAPYSSESDFGRAEMIADALRKLQLPESFRLVEVACGNGNVLDYLQGLFPKARMFGMDLFRYPEWDGLKANFKHQALQDLVEESDDYEVCIMLNSYRNWKGPEKDRFDRWLKEHVGTFISSGELPFPATRIGEDFKHFDMMMSHIPK